MKFHIVHDWGKWSDPIDTFHDCKKVQSRICKKCGIVQIQKVKQPFNLWFSVKTLLDAHKNDVEDKTVS